jgi:23S rRNA (cytosine1962-C5)-methyltransferase
MLLGEKPPAGVSIREHGHTFVVNLIEGQKTGLYLDQRDNRAILQQGRFSTDRDVLNVFSYTGGFALYAIAGGARAVTNIDTSNDILDNARQNVTRNFGERAHDAYVQGDAFHVLREYRDSDRKFDVVILDPPKFAHSRRDVQSAARGYKDLNWLAFRILRPGGLLFTFSCSGLVDADLFQKIVFSAASDAGRDGRILYYLSQAPDHPILLTFPESAYLKGLLIQVT